MMLPAERGLVVVITPCGIRDLRIGNELLPWESIVEISAEKCRGHKIIVLRPTPGLLAAALQHPQIWPAMRRTIVS